MIRPLACLLLAAGICTSAFPVAAQELPGADAPAHVSFVDGDVILEREGAQDSSPGSMPLIAGDRLRTEGGRAEVLFADGSALHLDTGTVVDFQSDEVVRLLQGTIRLSIAGPSADLSYRVDAPSAWVEIRDPGEYRIALLRDGEVELAVLRGAAELVNEQGRSRIGAGERTYAAAGSAPSPPYVYNSAAWDAFDRWSEDRRAQRRGVSAQYLPSEVRPYAAAFDTYGAWRYEQPHGYVWYPRAPVGWRPYHHGRWVSLRPYGWTWVAADPWGWPTHHYGRWGFSAGVWFWIPGRHWGPAWVSWAYAPSYVSWCPLGWNNRPVFQIVNVNVFGGRAFTPWHGWTVVPRRHFGGSFVHVTKVATVRIDQRIHRTFVVRDRAPEVRYAVGRSAAPIRTAGRYAVPRGGVTAGAVGARAVDTSRGVPDRERRLPAAARAPGTPVAGSRGDVTAPPAGTRAVPRGRQTEPSAGPASSSSSSSRSSRTAGAAGRRTGQSPEGASAPEGGPGAGPAREGRAAAPAGNRGARAVPRTAPPSGAGAVQERGDRQSRRAAQPRSAAPAATPPRVTPPPAGAVPARRGSDARPGDGAVPRARPAGRAAEPGGAPAYGAPPAPGQPSPESRVPARRRTLDGGSSRVAPSSRPVATPPPSDRARAAHRSPGDLPNRVAGPSDATPPPSGYRAPAPRRSPAVQEPAAPPSRPSGSGPARTRVAPGPDRAPAPAHRAAPPAGPSAAPSRRAPEGAARGSGSGESRARARRRD